MFPFLTSLIWASGTNTNGTKRPIVVPTTADAATAMPAIFSLFFVFGLILFVLIGAGILACVTETDAFSSKSISWAEYNISKLEQKIENSNKEYDIIRYQTKIQKWEKNKEYYFNQIKENSENLH